MSENSLQVSTTKPLHALVHACYILRFTHPLHILYFLISGKEHNPCSNAQLTQFLFILCAYWKQYVPSQSW